MSLFVPKPIRKGQNDQSAAGTKCGKNLSRASGAGKKLLSLEIKSLCWGDCISQNLRGFLSFLKLCFARFSVFLIMEAP